MQRELRWILIVLIFLLSSLTKCEGNFFFKANASDGYHKKFAKKNTFCVLIILPHFLLVLNLTCFNIFPPASPLELREVMRKKQEVNRVFQCQ